MKKVLLAVATLCCSFGIAHAQYNTLSINNATSCTVYVQVNGNVNGGVCAPDYRSNVLAIPPGITTYNDPSTVPGGVNASGGTPTLTAMDNFNSVMVYTDEPITANTCGSGAHLVSDCFGTPPLTSVPSVTFNDWTGGCANSCGTVDINWNVISPTHARVDIQ